jgi:hypothetical protein
VKRVALATLLMVSALLLTGCATYSGGTTQQVREWANGAPWDQDNQTIEADLTDLGNGLRARALLPLRTACAAFPADVSALYNSLPTPDTELTDELNTALTNFDKAATDCYDAKSFTAAQFHAYERELAAGKSAYHAAQQRLLTFGVR